MQPPELRAKGLALTPPTRVHVDDVASQKVLEAAGFTRVGVEDRPEENHQDFVYERRP